MNKQNFFIDFDNTLIHTIDAFCSVYNKLYINHPKFKPAVPDLVNEYNFKDQCPLVENVLSIFESPLFFKFARLINNNTYEILEKISKKYKPIICSIGTPRNIAYKAHYLEEKIPFIKDYVLITNQDCKMDKGIVNMQGAVFLDDIPSNLISSNAKEKLLFGTIYPWNLGWDSRKHCLDWSEVGDRLL